MSSVLAGRADLKDALQPTGVDGLWMIASGPVGGSAAELLGSPEMGAMLDQLSTRFDFVLLDTAPALVVADAVALAPRTDGVIVVADASKTARSAVVHTRHQLERVGGRIIGGVLNNLDPRSAKRYPAYYRQYYSSEQYRERQNGGRAKRGAIPAPPVATVDPPAEGTDREMWS